MGSHGLSGQIAPLTRLVITTGHLNALWKTTFDAKATRRRVHLGTPAKYVKTMARSNIRMDAAHPRRPRLELPYPDGARRCWLHARCG